MTEFFFYKNFSFQSVYIFLENNNINQIQLILTNLKQSFNSYH